MMRRYFIGIGAIALAFASGCVSTTKEFDKVPTGERAFARTIDIRGKTISTYPLYETARNMKELDEGAVLQVIVENFPALIADYQAWSRMTGNPIVEMTEHGNYYIIYIEKRKIDARAGRMSLVLSSDGMLDVLSPLGFALSAALSGTEVSIYFQGPGVHLLKRGFKEKLPGIQAPFSSIARKGLNDLGHVPPQEKIAELIELGAGYLSCCPFIFGGQSA